ncbi:molybdopterin synthase catalytic subunit MoaE [Bowmanella sp. Y26]|uniref:molybdopterin synthase catalytic subunit MoaE n=1 Tax=Bowmanella yangjiangensis TaxID=2811230 RepID=UPI001BDDC51B|nr:molybdopterin synthase catalytic subunit MoaE [Bowmanella yangjiangensis]MBT1063385.1 molybdopterin synthase catalytic subunit MoaE [Bowmanella yangjiangensis]
MQAKPPSDFISVREANFSQAEEYLALCAGNRQDGAIVSFVGLVRDINPQHRVQKLTLEHYPAMTEKSLKEIVTEARSLWPVGRIRLIHRVGALHASEQIVFVGVSSRHRGHAFQACEFIMDQLKTRAPFWKKEQDDKGEYWVQASQQDQQKARQWLPQPLSP